ncbi:unnamed protein product [Allacma fusca]|uniref:Uncharacterized protein n=1 Tax=Allacma fusca TaxID=39272 RepID=A0A8J2NVQ5_9HEXA|nr:unnamed protein product [Allacma fusca]
MYLRKGSKFRTAINYGIAKLQETGHIRYLTIRWLPRPGYRACENVGDGITSITLHHTKRAFIFLAVATLSALFCLISEIIIEWKYRHRQSVNNENVLQNSSLQNIYRAFSYKFLVARGAHLSEHNYNLVRIYLSPIHI